MKGVFFMNKVNDNKTNIKPGEGLINELDTKLSEFESFCIKNNLPFYISVATEHIAPIKYITKSISPREFGLNLSDDRITTLSLSNNKNLKLVFKDEKKEIDVGDLYGALMKQI